MVNSINHERWQHSSKSKSAKRSEGQLRSLKQIKRKSETNSSPFKNGTGE